MLKGILPEKRAQMSDLSDVSRPQHLLTCRMLREQLQPQLTAAWSVDTTRKVPSGVRHQVLHCMLT